jgi:hypothetical protein
MMPLNQWQPIPTKFVPSSSVAFDFSDTTPGTHSSVTNFFSVLSEVPIVNVAWQLTRTGDLLRTLMIAALIGFAGKLGTCSMMLVEAEAQGLTTHRFPTICLVEWSPSSRSPPRLANERWI